MVPAPGDFHDIVIRGDKIFNLFIIFNAFFVIFLGSDTTASFVNKSVKKLKPLKPGIDTSKCIQKWDLFSVLRNAKNEDVTKDCYKNATIEEATLNQHERKKGRSSTKIYESTWYNCNIIEETRLPYKIIGTWLRRTGFDSNKRMKRSIDARPWSKLIISKGKRLHGVWKKSTCLDSYECSNPNCSFIKYHRGSNTLKFKINDFTCNVCWTNGKFKSCLATQVWEFDDVDSKLKKLTVAITHIMLGNHLNHRQKSLKGFLAI